VTRVASLAAAACAILVTACTAGHPPPIYPSEIVVPSPGCWRFTLSWNGHTDTLDLRYVRHR